MSNDILTVIVGGVAVVAGYLAFTGDSEGFEFSLPSMPQNAPQQQQSSGGTHTLERNGTVYNDPTTSQTATFSDAPSVDPTSYAPDTEESGTAPSDTSAPLSDPGDSQVYGDAPEHADDDLNRVGNMDDETASAFDRLANYDDPENL